MKMKEQQSKAFYDHFAFDFWNLQKNSDASLVLLLFTKR